VLSLGAGVQSSTLLLLSIRGELPPLDAAIFADTGFEPRAVYDHLVWLGGIAEAAGVPLYRVSRGNIRADVLRSVAEGTRCASLPFFVEGASGDAAVIWRQCTDEYKLRAIRAHLRRLVGLMPGEVAGSRVHVEQWVGISADEIARVRQSREHWITLRYPLIFDLRPAWNRADCVAWLRREYPEHPVPRSACIGCPLHSNAEWRRMRECDPASWAEAVAFDRAIRQLPSLRGKTYLHRSCRPLDEAPIDEVDPGQGTLFSCGICGT